MRRSVETNSVKTLIAVCGALALSLPAAAASPVMPAKSAPAPVVNPKNDPNRLAKYYLQILTGVTNDQVVLDPGGWLPFGGSETIPFYLNEADATEQPVGRLYTDRVRTIAGR